jgi:hypothetical protein
MLYLRTSDFRSDLALTTAAAAKIGLNTWGLMTPDT